MELDDFGLEKIDIFSVGLFNKYNSNMYKFCIRNEIKTVKDLISYIEKYSIDCKTKSANDEVSGIIDLIKYKYCNVALPCIDILNNKFIKKDFMYIEQKNRIDWHYSKQLKVFRKLGFTKEEAKSIILFGEDIENELSVGEVLQLYLDSLNNISYNNVIREKVFLLVTFYKLNNELYNRVNNKVRLRNEIESLIKAKDRLIAVGKNKQISRINKLSLHR